MSGFSNANCFLESVLLSLISCPQQIIFDECHKAKNATSTKMGKAVLDLQNQLPRARVVYASATGTLTIHKWGKITRIQCDRRMNLFFYLIFAPGASEPKNMIYMSRLGIWGEGTPFRAFDDFLHAIEKRFVQPCSKALCI